MSQHNNLKQAISEVVATFPDPETGRSLDKSDQIRKIDDHADPIVVEVGLTRFSRPIEEEFRQRMEEQLRSAFPDKSFRVDVVEHHRPPMPRGTVGLKARAVIAVGSGKGGVGKSTVSTLLAMALQRSGCRVGLLDTDVYGPSIPHLTGVRGQVERVGDKIGPLDFAGLPVMSIGFMVPPEQAVIWRGPMLHSTVQTFVRDVAWGELDFLIIDMPPGTGDVALSLSQLLPISGAIVVCTPQEVALIDAIKAVSMFEKVNIPLVGLVENMSSFICPDNGKRYDIFGKGGARKFAEQANIPFLGEIPISIPVRERGDAGQMAANFDDPAVSPYLQEMAIELCRTLAKRAAANPVQPELPVLG